MGTIETFENLFQLFYSIVLKIAEYLSNSGSGIRIFFKLFGYLSD